MTVSSPKIKKTRRTRLWFGQYDHCVSLHLPESGSLRGLDHGRIDRVLKIRSDWGRKIMPNPGGSWHSSWQKLEITPTMRDNLHSMCDWLLSQAEQIKITISGDWIYLYTSDTGLVKTVTSLPWLDAKMMTVTQAVTYGRPDAVMLRKPLYQYRTYMRYQNQTGQQAAQIRNVIKNQQDIRLSPSLQVWVNECWYHINEYYFIDHNDMGIITMLSLVNPRLIRKTLPIVADK